MDIIYESTKLFEKDLAAFQQHDKQLVIAGLNRYGSEFAENPATAHRNAYRPMLPQLKGDLSATLYTLRVGRDIRVILAVDDDPLFDQLILTLFRVVRHDKLDRAYKGIAEALYQRGLHGFSEGGNSDG